MSDSDPRLKTFGEAFNTLLRERSLTRAEIERRMVRGKGYLYRCFKGFQGLSVGTLLHALDEAGIPFEEFCLQLARETHPDLLSGSLATVSQVEREKMVREVPKEQCPLGKEKRARRRTMRRASRAGKRASAT